MGMDMLRIGSKLISENLIERIDLEAEFLVEDYRKPVRCVRIVMTNHAIHEYSGKEGDAVRVWLQELYPCKGKILVFEQDVPKAKGEK